ncbi:hypothetical protein B0T25DRAFT_555651 [Lasiosphaeria hispida]|uniref:Phosphatidate phosphatase APP1 catalytic domain-containing protein n=1 Tax=Lasiosphaeria hispida TaxID=260671 RepID=A0AAJ0H900_9PEZI|nr:hypothetical protein B0T25DRAFT_555651 [Lasiosphaeria hispida]
MSPPSQLALLWALPAVLGLPNPTPLATPTPSPVEQRDVASLVGSAVSDVGRFFQDLPTGSAVEKALGISDSDLAAEPTQVLNLPSYGNWTDDGWNVLVHGNVYKVPDVAQSKLDALADVFLIGTDIKDLPPAQQNQARNLTASIYVVQQSEVNVTITFVNDVDVDPQSDGGAVNAAGGAQSIRLPDETTSQGDFGAWLLLANTTGPDPKGGYLVPGNVTDRVQTLNMHANGTDTGNATAYLVPPKGVTVISDIDDILRITKIWDPKEGLLNSFARPFTPWMNMPGIYSDWSRTNRDFHFHYLTTTPEQATRNYMEFIFANYPIGSFDTRPLNFSDVSATISIRKFLLDRIFQSFPERKFILVGDTSNSDVMRAYPQLNKDYPDNVLCILLRNSSSTDSTDHFPYDTSHFEGIPQSQYMFFNVPDDLRGLDVAKGECYNATVPQNVTFGLQGFSLDSGTDVPRPSVWGLVLGLGVVFGLVL